MSRHHTNRAAAVAIALAVVAAACSDDATLDGGEPVYSPGAATTEAPDITTQTEPADQPEPADQFEPADQPEPADQSGQQIAVGQPNENPIEMVPVTIDEIGVDAMAPRGWEWNPARGFVGSDGELGFGALPTSDAPDPAEGGFAIAGETVAGDRTWLMYELEAPSEVVRLALFEAGSITYVVSLATPTDSAATYVNAVLQPALDAFEIVGGGPITLAGTPPTDSDLSDVLAGLIDGTELPAVGVTLFDSERVIESAVTGVRRAGHPTPVEIDDRFSIGSNAKAMTATLVAMFVDEGVIDWDTTVAEAFDASVADIDPAWHDVTIRRLLSHTAGIDDEQVVVALGGVPEDGTVTEQRDLAAEATLAGPPNLDVGDYLYSNIGYTIVGALLDELSGMSWEQLMQTRLFDPLGMESCGFLAAGTPGQVDQPWGHWDERGGEPLDPGHPDADLPAVIAPAGLVHCAMHDWATFLQSQLRGFAGSETELISPAAFAALAEPAEGSDYALGWVEIVGGDEPIGVYHQGSNLRFTAEVWLLPGEDRGLVTVTNLGEGLATSDMNRVAAAMFERYG